MSVGPPESYGAQLYGLVQAADYEAAVHTIGRAIAVDISAAGKAASARSTRDEGGQGE